VRSPQIDPISLFRVKSLRFLSLDACSPRALSEVSA
jgi:hypothetical protein